MSYLAKSRRRSNTVLRMLLAYLVLTSALPVPRAAQTKAKATPAADAPGRKTEPQSPRGTRGAKDGVTPNALQANGKIAFTANRDGNLEIYSMNPDGTNQVNLTNNAADDFNPAFSPNGGKLVFVSNRDGNDELYLMNADGTSQTRLTNDAASDTEPVFSPDGSKIAFRSDRDGNSEVYLMNADGTAQVNLTNNPAFDAQAAFSPDAGKIIFASDRDGNLEVYLMNADGTAPVNLSNNAANDSSPDFSPDGGKVVFLSDRDANNELYVMNADGTSQTRLTNDPASDEDPAFSPDGSKIAFETNRDGNFEIYLMNANGTGPIRLTNDAAPDVQATYQTLLSCTPPPPNGVAWYRAEENALDSFGTNHGTLENGTGISQGFVGSAFNLDGVDDDVDIGQLTGLQNAQQLTLMAWVKKRDLNNTIAGIIGKWDGCTGCTDDTFLLYNGEGGSTHKGGFVVRFTDDTAAGVAGATDIPVGQWVHIAATWRSSDGEIKIYKNGRLDGSGTGGAGQTLKYQTNYTAKLGEWGEGHGGNPLYRFGGNIDEATIFSRALSQAEIKNVYDAKSAGKCLASAAQTITTSNTNDSGPGSLRQAILDANASPGTQTINFQIPGAGVKTISLSSALPAIADPVIIDGYTQPGASANTLANGDNAVLLVELNGAGAGASVNGLNITGGGSTVRGLVVNRFTAAGVRLATANANTVEGCFIGTNSNGTIDLGNTTDGVIIVSSSDNSIGGTSPAARNVISGNNSDGVEINGGNLSGNLIRGNYIGTNASGAASVPNLTGINVAGTPNITNNTVGGLTTTPGTGAGNVISGNSTNGILLNGSPVSGTLVQGNLVGLSADGTTDLGNGADGINVSSSPNNTIGGANTQARNVISGNNSDGIQLSSAPGNTIQNNYVGTDATGTLDLGNTTIGITATACANLSIGGAGAGNVISGNGSDGVALAGASSGASIAGNFVGTDATGMADLGNSGDGIQSTSVSVTIGGTTAAERNIISGNNIQGINLLAASNVIRGNFIGLAADGVTALNNLNGILIGNAVSNSVIGGTGAGQANTIAFNNGDGVTMSGTGTGNRISGNSIHSNGTFNDLGIDLGTNGVTPNDANDPDTGSNNLQNFPVLSSVSSGGGLTTITGTLNSTPNTTFSVEFFSSQVADQSGNGEGQTFLGAASLTTDASGNVAINETLPVALTPVAYVSATATDPANSTSEFSNSVPLATATLTVTNTNNSGAGSLPQAITDSNLIAGAQTINFQIPGGGVKTIELPSNQGMTATGPVSIDGYTQPGASPNTLANGNDAVLLIDVVGDVPTVLTLQGGSSTVRGLVLRGSGNNGVNLSSNDNVVEGCFIGTDATGTLDRGNVSGVSVSGVNNRVGGATPAARNLVSGNATGVLISGAGASGNIVQGNYIGTDRNGTAALANSQGGVFFSLSTFNNTLGGTGAGAGNLISGNLIGIIFQTAGSGNVLQGNLVGTDAAGTAPLGNERGISLNLTGDTTIGGTAAGAGNTIAFNNSEGVLLFANATSGTAILGNSIHSNTALGIDLNGDNIVTPNDAGDPDTGSNDLQNFPSLTSSSSSGGTTTITGTLNSTASTTFRIEFFSSAACDPSGNGEGRTFLGFQNVTTDGSGNAAISATLAVAVANGEVVTATATDPANNTSEFSACQTVVGGASTTVSWINPAGGAWNVAANWQDGNGVNRVPTAGDDAIINLAGTYTVTLDSAVAINSLNLGAASGAQTLDTGNFPLTIANNSLVQTRGVLVVNSTLNGGGNLDVNGTLEQRGTLSGAGTINIANGATLNLDGSQPVLSRTINNSGTVNYAVTNSFVFSNGTLNNLASGIFNVQVEKLLFQNGGTNLFNNAGTLRKATGAGTMSFNLPFNNNGTIDLQTGTLDFSVSGTSGGQFNGAAGTTFDLTNQTLTASSSINAPALVINGGTNSIAGSYNVTGTSNIAGTVAITGNVLSVGSTLTIGGRVDFNSNNIVAPLVNLNGTLAGSANVTLTASGTLNYNGTMLGTGTTDIPSGATLNIGGSQPQLLRTLNNAGTANYAVLDSMVFSNGTFNNLPGAVFDVQAEKLMFQNAGANLFANQGTVRKLAGAGTTEFRLPFNNSGTVNLQAGTLDFSVSGTSTGQFNGSNGTTFSFNALTLQAAASLAAPTVFLSGTSSIAGSYSVESATNLSGTTTFSGNVASVGSTLTISGTANFNSNNITAQTINLTGTLSGSANVSPSSFGTLNFDGTMSGTGATDIPAGATLNVGGSQPVLSRTLNNAGTANYAVTNSMVFSGGTLNNLAGGIFNLQAEKLLFQNGGANLFNNAGTLRKTLGAATTDINVPVANSGTVESQSGTLAFGATYTQTAGSTKLNGGNLQASTLLNIQGGALSGTGTITGNVQNAGTLAPGLSPGVLNLTGNYTQTASGTLAIEIGGTSVGSQYDQLNVSGTATLGGTLDTTLTNGFNPGFNDAFVVLTYGARSGTFSVINAPAFTPVYNANNLTLASNAPPPSILSVTNTNDSGAGSLRQAIIDSNNTAGVQNINFQIPVPGVQTITPASPLPQITDPVVVDGYTQPNSSANTQAAGDNAVLLVELNGANAGAGAHGLNLNAGGTTVRGLVINRFGGSGVNISGGSNNRVEGNFIGTNASGISPLANNRSVDIAGSQNNVIGGTSAAARNLLSGNSQGVNISGGSNNHIEGNFIGTNAAGTAALANTLAGILLNTTTGNTVGGTAAGAGNVVSGNATGIFVTQFSTNNIVQGNFVGTAADGVAALPNAVRGIFITQSSNGNGIGGAAGGAGNVVAFNTGDGIVVDASSNNAVVGNSIHSNAALGLDLLPAGITANDAGDADSGSNNLQNFPLLTSVSVAGGNTTFNGTLASAPNTNYALHFYANAACDASGNGEGQTYLAAINLTTDASGNAAFNSTFNGLAVQASQFVTATATDASGNTSEFGACVQATAPPSVFTISGQILEGASGLGGVTLTLTGSQSAATTTDANGNYAFANLPAGNYVVTPSLVNYTFTPPSAAFNNLSANGTGNFNATLNTYTLSGHINDSVNANLGGATVTLGGSQSATTTTDANGNYAFANVAAGGNYTVTPALANYTFAPPSRTVGNLSGNQTALDFTGTLNAVTISGQVTEAGSALSGVTITLSGAQSGTATTDAGGNYSFNVSSGGDYVIIPSLANYAFNPSGRAVNNLTGNLTANFAATRNTHSIGGQIKDNNNASLAGVTVALSGGQSATTTTDANGNYSFANLPAGSNYIVTPQFPNYAFAPASAAFNNLNANQTASFTGTPGARTISGRVADAGNNALSNVTITLSGAQSGTALTDAGGNYAFNVAAGASYTVTPALTNYTFAPPSASFNNIAANQTANFTGTLQTFSLGGRVGDNGNNGIAGVTVALSGGQTATTTTDAGGNYSFTNLPAGANYTVTPTRAGYTFTPPFATFNNLSANAAANFLALATPTEPQSVSGRVVQGGVGIGNVTLYVTDANTGANVASTLTDAGGNYALTLPPGGDYTITTARSGLTFQPAARTFANLNGGQVSDFTATKGLSISGRVAGPNGNGIGNVSVTLGGSVSRTTQTLPNGSFLFNNVPAQGSYVVQADSGLLTFNPPQIVRPGLSADATLSLVATPRPAPVPTPPIEEDFGSTTRDTLKFTIGTLTQPPGSHDLLIAVAQEGGKFKITPRGGIDEASFNGYVSTRAINFNDAQAGIEVNQTADNGAQTIFAVGRDERNFFRFVAQDIDAPNAPAAKSGVSSAHSVGLRRLIFQARNAGVLNGLSASIPYDAVLHRYWRFRHSSAESAMFFETSPDRVVWTAQRRVALGASIGSLAIELGAGTSGRVTNPGQAIFDNLSVQPSAFVNRANNVRLAQSSYRVSEGAGVLTLKVMRAGDASRETQIDYATEPHDGKPCNTPDGKARARCDFGTTAGTIRFAPGETEKSFSVFITDDIYAEGDETVRLALGFPSAGVVEEPASALVTITDNDAGASAHPINTAPFLVRQQYLDFLNREPDENGFNAWVKVLTQCAYEGHFGPGKSGSDPACDRITVSSSFFRSSEFQIKGYFVYRFYKASLGRVPTYEEFLRDMTSVTGRTEAEVVARREAFAEAWVERADFVALNEGITNAEFVEQLATTAGVPIAGRAQLISDLNDGRRTRAQALRAVVDSPELFNREYNAAFVLMQYFGYLQRDPDEAGYNSWLNLLNRTGDYRTMIFGFLYSQEYVLRFGPP